MIKWKPNLDDGSCTGKINLEISLDIVWEKCSGFHIVGSKGFHEIHSHMCDINDMCSLILLVGMIMIMIIR